MQELISPNFRVFLRRAQKIQRIFKIYHMLMPYVLFDIKWLISHQMKYITSKYDISQFCRGWVGLWQISHMEELNVFLLYSKLHSSFSQRLMASLILYKSVLNCELHLDASIYMEMKIFHTVLNKSMYNGLMWPYVQVFT